MPSIGGITYTEIDEGYRERMRQDSQETTRLYDVAWKDRIVFLRAVLGWSQRSFDSVSGKKLIARFLPHADPSYPWLFAQEADLVRGLGVPARASESDTGGRDSLAIVRRTAAGAVGSTADGNARYAVKYMSPNYDVIAGKNGHPSEFAIATACPELERYVIREQDYEAQSFTFPYGSFKFKGSNIDLLEPPTLPYFTKQLTYTWLQVPVIPEAAIRACIGKTNKNPFDVFNIFGSEYPAGALLFLGPVTKRHAQNSMPSSPQQTERYAFNIPYKFSYNPNGWNFVFRVTNPVTRANQPGWYEVVRTTDETKGIFDQADFNELFAMP